MKKLNFRMIFSVLFCVASVSAAAQSRVSGRVTGSDGAPLIGVTITVEGTSQGTITASDGAYSIAVTGQDPVLSFAYVGLQPQSVAVAGRSVVDVVMREDIAIDQVVVIGYGQQKKSVVTAAISTVSNTTLEKASPIRLDDALKGLTAGVMVTSESGQPGAGSRVRIRGIGTINTDGPLYVVDGIPMSSGIDYLAPGDIARVDILKDAASAAVYGTRGANGVILVTTKTGAGMGDRVRVNYDFQYGVANPWRQRDVLNATEYAVMMNEGSLNSGGAIKYADPYSYGKGTDWQEALFNKNAPVVSHQLSVSGASGRNVYYLSVSHLNEEGIIGGNYDRSNYERFTVRLNDTYTLFDKTKERNWLNKMSVTTNTSYSRTVLKGISTNSETGSPLFSAISMSPILDIYAPEEMLATYQAQRPGYSFVRDKNNGKLFTIPSIPDGDYGEMVNPLALLSLPGDRNNYHRVVANFDASLGIWDALTFKSSVGVDMGFSGVDGWTPNFFLSASSGRSQDHSSVFSEMGRSLTWQVENVLSYEKSFGRHNISAIVGQSALETTGQNLRGSRQDLIDEDPSKANLNFATGSATDGKQSASGYLWADYRLASLFARASYSFDDRYLFQATIRRDGSSKFGKNNRFAIFPSFSVGWNIRNEAFMENRANWLSALKLRASWGRNGNDRSVGDFAYTTLTAVSNHVFGSGALGNEAIVTGMKSSGTPNPNLKWEQSQQTDIGLDLGFFNGALNIAVDYYKKRTEGMIIRMPINTYVGAPEPYANVGKMDNSGFEFEVNYRKRVGGMTFFVGANATYLKNKVVNLGNETGILPLDTFGTAGTITQAQNGLPYPYFFGLKTAGIFQNQAEIDAYTYTNADGVMSKIQPNVAPGDVRFVDVNNDGIIDDADRTMIGKGTPDWTFGFNAGFEWKGFDFSMIWQGVIGADVFDGTYRHGAFASGNMPRWMLDRWTGEGTSNKIPRYSFSGNPQNWQSSDLYIKDGSYLRLKNITLGYTLPVQLTQKAFVQKLRFYVSATNLLTFTKYDGFDPEIASGGTSLGVDRGVYPQARTFYFGANLSF